MTVSQELAKRIKATTFETLPPEALHWARIGILDTLGVTVAGSIDPSAELITKSILPGSGPSLLHGKTRRTSALDAALINGTASHALDFDDCNNTLGGHPSAVILPALFALADDQGATGRDFITAYVVGFETECKVSMGVNFYQYTHGWHPTSTIGIFGTAAACAHLMKLSEEQTATAISIAASLAAGIKSNFGTMVKPLHVGHCCRSGLFAALLAKNDYTASPVAFEHKQGYFEVFNNGPANYDADKIFAHWAKPLDIVAPGIAVKQYPCCGSTHPAIDAMLKLVKEHDVKPDAVERIDSWTHARRLEHTNRADPQSQKDAKFSVQYCLARAVLERKVVVDHFEGDAYLDANVRAIMSRINVAPYTTAQFPESNHFGAEVKVTLKGGAVLSKKVDQPNGRTSANPLSDAELKDKFMNCVTRVLPLARAQAAYAAIMEFEKLADVGAIGAALTGEPIQQTSGSTVNA
jgi:2-methylcitrate dehydratase PrpD